MSRKRKPAESNAIPAPKFLVSYAAMVTLLLAFFIILNNLATQRQFGFKGAGVGAFKAAFNSCGLPGILQGLAKPIQFLFSTPKHVPEPTADEAAKAQPYDGRLITAPDPDLQNSLVALLKSQKEVRLPLAVTFVGEDINSDSRARLSRLARVLQMTDCDVAVVCTITTGTPALRPHDNAWLTASRYATLVADHLCFRENIPPSRVRTLANVVPKGSRSAEARGAEQAPLIALSLTPTPQPLPWEQRQGYRPLTEPKMAVNPTTP